MLGLTARYAERWDAWMTETGTTAERTAALLAAVDAAGDAAGRHRASLERTVTVEVQVLPRRGSIFTPDHVLIDGSPATFVEALRPFADLGVAEVQLVVRPCSLEGLDALAPALEAFRSARRS